MTVVNGPIPSEFLQNEENRLNSLRFDNGKLEVLDQLLLPHEFKYLPVNGVDDAYHVIKTMKVRGAPLIATVGCLGLYIEIKNHTGSSDDLEWIKEKIEYLVSSRPTAVDLRNALHSLLPLVEKHQLDEILEKLLEVYQKEKEENRRLVWNGYQELISAFPNKQKLTIMTICNTGSLATCSWGTALGVIRALHSENRLELVYALETRPYNQGVRLTAAELLHGNVPFKLITDSMAASVMKTRGVDAILTGADNVALNGDTANKIGTYMLAVADSIHDLYLNYNFTMFSRRERHALDLSHCDEKVSSNNYNVCWSCWNSRAMLHFMEIRRFHQENSLSKQVRRANAPQHIHCAAAIFVWRRYGVIQLALCVLRFFFLFLSALVFRRPFELALVVCPWRIESSEPRWFIRRSTRRSPRLQPEN